MLFHPRSIHHRAILFFATFLLSTPAYSLTLSFESLSPVSSQVYTRLRDQDPLILGERTNAETLALPLSVFEPLVQEGAARHLSALEFYFDPLWRSLGDRALVIDRETLRAVNQHYDLSSLFPEQGELRKAVTYRSEKHKAGEPFEKEFVVIHADRSVTLYPFPVLPRSTHYPILSATGFDFYRVNILYRADSSQEDVSISRLVGRNEPSEELAPIRGALGMKFLSLRCPLPCHTIQVETSSVHVTKRAIPITRR